MLKVSYTGKYIKVFNAKGTQIVTIRVGDRDARALYEKTLAIVTR